MVVAFLQNFSPAQPFNASGQGVVPSHWIVELSRRDRTEV
jgi:hypothetical protein